MTRQRLPHHRRLRIERNEDRRLLSAAPVAQVEVSADDTPAYLPIYRSGWLQMDEDSQLASIDFSLAGTSEVISLIEQNASQRDSIQLGDSLTLGGVFLTTEAFSHEATSVRLSLDSGAGQVGYVVAWGGVQSSQQSLTLLGGEFSSRVVAIDTAFAEAVFSNLQDDQRPSWGNSGQLVDVVQRWLNENQDFLKDTGPLPPGWIPDSSGAYVTEGGKSSNSNSNSELGSWSDLDSNTGPATPSLDNSFTFGEDNRNDGLAYTLSNGDDVSGGSRLLSKLREWLRDESARVAIDSLEASNSRTRVASTPLERVTETPAPEAGEEAPGAGMIDLAALLLPAAADEAPSVVLAAATQPADGEVSVSARDAALAVESWVRTLPVPTEVGVVEGVAPPVKESAVGVRNEAPVKQVLPQSQAARDHVSSTSRDAAETRQTLDTASERAAERLDERQATSGPGYAAAWLTTLLGGAVVWANRRGSRHRASDCIEPPRRETGRIA